MKLRNSWLTLHLDLQRYGRADEDSSDLRIAWDGTLWDLALLPFADLIHFCSCSCHCSMLHQLLMLSSLAQRA